MKQKILAGVLVVAGLFLFGTAWAGPATATEAVGGPYTAPGDFTTKFWMEKFVYAPGDIGNVLMAIGKGFTLQNVVLTAPPTTDTSGFNTDWCVGGLALKTVYTQGRLTLNSSGPWLKRGTLIDRDVTATNISCHKGDGSLAFRLKIVGTFKEFGGVPYSVETTFNSAENRYELLYDDDGNNIGHRGYDFGATITIGE